MALKDPVAVYNAANNAEVYVVQDALTAAGIEAFITEDNAGQGLWALGMLPEIHKPQVWVERVDAERVKPILAEFERRKAELSGVQGDELAPEVRAKCDECERYSFFPAGQLGSVQHCEHCGAFMDVEDPDRTDDWEIDESEAEPEV